jgi:acyl-[acyl-carrier-protein]-phospholipid O-acyltransferase/long-chain-fatty-acid--[acyl-carrier-protein] ligase
MVPHINLEERVNALIGADATSAVTAVPDPSKGERLVVLYTDPNVTPHQLWERLSQTELPRLWLPKREDLHVIEAVPTLGTGKVDLRAIRRLALEKSAAPAA